MDYSKLYDEYYYMTSCGDISYLESEKWRPFYEGIADKIVKDLNPSTVLDVGCAVGYLVAALRDRGVKAYGIDISEFAVSKVREDIKPYCMVWSATEPLPEAFPQKYDLLITIEVAEHLYEEDASKFIENICRYSDKIIFSSTPDDIYEKTHFNVQQAEYWAKRFAQNKFFKDLNYDVSYISPQSCLFAKQQYSLDKLVEDYERHVRIIRSQIQQMQKEYRDSSYISTLFLDYGNGFTGEASIVKTSTDFEFYNEYEIDSNVKAIRFDPVEGKGCIVHNLEIISNNGQLRAENLNGAKIDTFNIFTTKDPQLLIDLKDKPTSWIRIKATIIPFETMAMYVLLSKFFRTNTEKQKIGAELEEILTENSAVLDERAELLAEIEAKEAEIDELLKIKEAEILSIKEEREALLDSIKKRDTISEQQENIIENLEETIALQDIELAASHETISKHEVRIQEFINANQWLQGELGKYQNAYDNISKSTLWKLTKPVRILLDVLKRIVNIFIHNFITRSIKKVVLSLRKDGIKKTAIKVKNKLNKNVIISSQQNDSILHTVKEEEKTIEDFINQDLRDIQPISTVIVNEGIKRLNFVTDSIEAHSLLGGVATALVIASEFANKYNLPLRIITRTTPVNPLDYENILTLMGIKIPNDISFYTDYDRDAGGNSTYKLEISDQDIFFATSWWSAKAIEKTTLRKRFFYIIQEVETFFYPHGDRHYLCSQVMKNPNIDFIVNSHYLFEYFAENEPNIVENGVYFEPAFPEVLYKPQQLVEKEKYKLFFYSRPNNPRNMFIYGIDILDKCIKNGIINTKDWDIYFAGQNIPEMTFCNGYKGINLGLLPWKEYGEFLGTVDLSLSLMYTPHPSYPPFDVASSGGVVVSNVCYNKKLFDWCDNVIFSDLDEEPFLEAMKRGVELAKNIDKRKENFEKSTIPGRWQDTVTETISFMGGRL